MRSYDGGSQRGFKTGEEACSKRKKGKMESVSLSGGESRFHPTNGSNAQRVRLGVLTVSDRASAGVYRDDSGPEILKFFHEAVKSEWEAVYRVIPDEGERIRSELIRMADEDDCCLIVTTGGTGPAKRDVTPEATESVCDRLMPGYAEQMRAISLKVVPTAVLSRQTAGSGATRSSSTCLASQRRSGRRSTRCLCRSRRA
jgi:molybdenum cofactor synthesis domain-containing protein